jgi:hypothetical protein
VNLSERLRRFWDSVRPRTRRGGFIAAAAILGGAAGLSVVLAVGVTMAWSPYLQYSLDNTVNAKQWAAMPLSYTASSTCQACHETEHSALVFAAHRDIGCQSCHGALLEHAEAGDEATSQQVPVRVPTDEVCLRCHTAATGRPAGFRQILPGQHYVAECLECHDPHVGTANRPPVVLHPLNDLPPCLTCHGPEGFKARNQRHPEGTSDDARCLECHAAGRGPAEDGNAASPASGASPTPQVSP